MATQAKIIIKGQNDITNAVKGAVGDLSALKGAAEKLGKTLKTSLSIAAIVASLKGLHSALSKSFDEFSTTEHSYRQLALALRDTKGFDAVKNTINALSTQTLASKSDIEAMAAELSALGKNADEISSISEAAVYLSNVTGKDLTSSMNTLLGTLTGAAGELSRLGVDVKRFTKDQLASGAAIDVVREKLGSLTEALAEESSAQHLKNMKDTWSDIKAQVGGILDYNFGPWFAKFDSGFSAIKTNTVNIVNYIGAVFKNLPEVFKLSLSTVWQILAKTFEWDSLKLIITTTAQNMATVLDAYLKAVFSTIPKILSSLFEGIINWIAHIALNIESSILGAIQNVIDKSASKVQGTWFGNLFGFGDKLAAINLGAEDVKASAQSYKQKADQSFVDIGPLLKMAITDAIDTAKTVTVDTKSLLETLYSGITTDFKSALDEIVAPDLVDIAQKADASNQEKLLESIASANLSTASSVKKIKEETKGRLGEQIVSLMNDKLTPLFSRIGGLASSGFIGMLVDEFSGGLNSLLSSIAPLIDIIFNALTPFGILLTIIEGFVSVIQPALTTVFQPLIDIFQWIGQSLASLFLPILDAVFVAFSLLANILSSILTPVLQSLEPIFSVISALMEALSPILLLLAKAFTILMSPVQFLGDLFSWLGQWIKHFGNVVSVAAYNLLHPFRPKSYSQSPGSFSSDAFRSLSDRLANIDAIAFSNTAARDSVATNTAVSSAAYQGSTHVTINIYQQAPVVGDGGMRSFAKMILGEFEQLDYFGVTV